MWYHRKDGSNKLIRIVGKNGKYGFAEPLEWDSLQAVIDHHRTNSLALYNRQLDMCLISPLSKHQVRSGSQTFVGFQRN